MPLAHLRQLSRTKLAADLILHGFFLKSALTTVLLLFELNDVIRSAVFDHVALAAEPDTLAGSGGGNLVAVASDAPIDVSAFVEAMGAADLDWSAIEGAVLERWIGDADVLVDDHAPVDQLLTPYG